MAAVPGTHDFVNGLADSSEMNSFVRDPLRFLMKLPSAELRQIVSQNILTGAAGSAITFTTSDVDQDYLTALNAGHSNTVNPSRYTAVFPGWYLVSGSVAFAANATGIRNVWLKVNGTDNAASLGSQGGTAADVQVVNSRPNHKVYLNVGDYVELWGAQFSTITLATYIGSGTWQSGLSVLWVSN